MFEGRNRCRELIEELQSSHGLEEQTKKQRQKEREQMIDLQRLQNEKSVQEDRLCEVLNSLEGMTISGMLDFLSKVRSVMSLLLSNFKHFPAALISFLSN